MTEYMVLYDRAVKAVNRIGERGDWDRAVWVWDQWISWRKRVRPIEYD